jgi:hypothetical protein
MPRKKKQQPARPAEIRWVFDPDIPTYDFLEGGSLDNTANLQERVENFVDMLEKGDFLTWEAVVCEEQGLPLTAPQRKALGRLIDFNEEEEDDQILYIDEIPRPSEPWHVILNKMVPHLLMEPFRTFDVHEDVKSDGWHRIMTALDEHSQGLSLPPGVASFREVVPAGLAAQAVAAVLPRGPQRAGPRRGPHPGRRGRRSLASGRTHHQAAQVQGECGLLRPYPGFAPHQGGSA